MTRVRTDNVFGTLTDNPLTNVATTMNSAGLANLAVVSSAEAIIVLDPNRVSGAPEIVVVTAHTGSATSATIVRGQFGTSAREHAAGTEWVHGPIASNASTFVTAADDQGDFVPMNGWESYAPTLGQNGTVTHTVTYAKFLRIGRAIFVNVNLAVTGTGNANNRVDVTLPVTSAIPAFSVVGSGWLFDSSAGLLYRAIVDLQSTTLARMVGTNSTANAPLGQDQFTAALAAGDQVNMSFSYEAAS